MANILLGGQQSYLYQSQGINPLLGHMDIEFIVAKEGYGPLVLGSK